MSNDIGPNHPLAAFLGAAVDAVLEDWNVQFCTQFSATALEAFDHESIAPRWVWVKLGLVGSEFNQFYVAVDERMMRCLVEAIGFVDMPDEGFDEEGLDAVGELGNLMAGALSRVVSERLPGMRVTQRAGDIEVETCDASGLTDRLVEADVGSLATFSVDSGTGEAWNFAVHMPQIAINGMIAFATGGLASNDSATNSSPSDDASDRAA